MGEGHGGGERLLGKSVTVATVLKESGYFCRHIGKWGLDKRQRDPANGPGVG